MSRSHDERGESLIEILVAVALLGIVFAAVLGGLATSVIGSYKTRQLATLNSALDSGAAAIAGAPYVACADDAAYDPGTPPSGYSIDVVAVRYWDGVDTFADGCDAPDNGLQELTLRASPVDGSMPPKTLTVVKRSAS